MNVAAPIELVTQALDPHRLPGDLAVAFLLGLARILLHRGTDRRTEGELAAIGRPGRLAGTILQFGQLARLTATEIEQVELGLAAACREEGEALPIGRPARRGVGLLAARQRARRAAAVAGNEPDARVILVGLLIDRGHDEGDLRAVRRNLRVADKLEREEIARGNQALGWNGHRGILLLVAAIGQQLTPGYLSRRRSDAERRRRFGERGGGYHASEIDNERPDAVGCARHRRWWRAT